MARRTTPDGETAVINVGLINNMPDAALQATERQFFSLLEAAAGSILVRLRLYSLPDVPRTEFGHQRVADRYWSIDDLWDSDLDGLIVTGREPQAADLREEPYWKTLTQVIDWAEDRTISSIWSCLVAHAALLHIDGIDRNPLGEKRFGLYDCAKIRDHPIMDGIPGSVPLPHSRWNDIQESNLIARGYDVLARSVSGPDIFAKKERAYSYSSSVIQNMTRTPSCLNTVATSDASFVGSATHIRQFLRAILPTTRWRRWKGFARKRWHSRTRISS